MPYRVKPSETIPEGIRRAAREQVDRAIRELTDESMDPHERIHQARKRFKKVRAILRLMYGEVEDIYSEENAFYRDLGREVSRVRDAEAMLETLDLICEAFEDELAPDAFASVRQALIERRQAIANEQMDLDETMAAIVADLRSARGRIAEWPLESTDFDAFDDGLKRTYKRAYKAFAKARKKQTPERLHEWRKRVKYHWYHTRLLERAWPDMMEERADQVHDLADILGESHDLDVFRAVIHNEPERYGSEEEIDALLGLVARLRKIRWPDELTLGRRVLAEKAGEIADRFEAYWEA